MLKVDIFMKNNIGRIRVDKTVKYYVKDTVKVLKF